MNWPTSLKTLSAGVGEFHQQHLSQAHGPPVDQLSDGKRSGSDIAHTQTQSNITVCVAHKHPQAVVLALDTSTCKWQGLCRTWAKFRNAEQPITDLRTEVKQRVGSSSMVLMWFWYGSGVALVWSWYGSGVGLVWVWYACAWCGSDVVLVWFWCGLVWFWYGLVSFWYGFGVVLIWSGVVLVWSGVVLVWLWCGSGMVLEWFWYGSGCDICCDSVLLFFRIAWTQWMSMEKFLVMKIAVSTCPKIGNTEFLPQRQWSVTLAFESGHERWPFRVTKSRNFCENYLTKDDALLTEDKDLHGQILKSRKH